MNKFRNFFRNVGLALQALFRALPKVTGLVVLNVILLSAVFQWKHAQLTNQTVSLALMVLLLALFSDLKEFDFWGLKGTRLIQEKVKKALESSKDQPAVDSSVARKMKNNKVTQRLEQQMSIAPAYSAGDLKTDFMHLAFDLERLMRLAASRLSKDTIQPSTPANRITDILVEKGLLTDSGREQVEAIRGIRNLIIHGRDDELNADFLQTGWELSYGIYTQLYNWMYGPSSELL